MGILSVDLNNINLDDINFDEDDVTLMKMIMTLFFISNSWLGVIDINNAKYVKKIQAKN